MPTPLGAKGIRGNGVLSPWQPARCLARVQMIKSTRAPRGEAGLGGQAQRSVIRGSESQQVLGETRQHALHVQSHLIITIIIFRKGN